MSPDGQQVLLVHRNRRPDDAHRGKYNGLGGKLERDEDIVSCIRREIREESGLECLDLKLRGTVHWPGFGKSGEDWFGFIFRIDQFSGTPYSENADGPLCWVDVNDMDRLPLWEGDRHFLPLVFSTGPTFHGVMPYASGHPLSWNYILLNS